MRALLATNAETHLAHKLVLVVDLSLPHLGQNIVVFERYRHHTGTGVHHSYRVFLVQSDSIWQLYVELEAIRFVKLKYFVRVAELWEL